MSEAAPKRPLPARISLVMSDVDGTLVTRDKRLTDPARAAASALRAKGVAFTVASSRPPFGLKSIVDGLDVTTPFASFNGGLIAAKGAKPLAAHWVPRDVAREIIEKFESLGFQVWAFTASQWLCRDADADYVSHERHTVSQDPTIVLTFDPYLDEIGKIVAVSADFPRLADCETSMQKQFGDRAMVARSQDYYLDVTHLRANKSEALKTIASALGTPLSECVAIGDGGNDFGMLRTAAFGIAMGNGVERLRAEADFVTSSNEEDGFAHAMSHILGSGS